MWAGFAVALPLVLWKGLCFYHPSLPALGVGTGGLGDYVTSPVLKAFLSEVRFDGIGLGLGLSFCILAVALLIETDVLPLALAYVLHLSALAGVRQGVQPDALSGLSLGRPADHGAFIAFALLALFVGRHHLARVFRLIVVRSQPAERREAWTYRGALLLVAASLAAIAGWSIWTRMGLAAGLLFFGYILVCGFAASKNSRGNGRAYRLSDAILRHAVHGGHGRVRCL